MVDSKPLFTGEEWDDIYGMPPNALKVWLFHYRCEIDGRESWPGEDLICYKLRICRDTLADNRKWLKDHGWLVQLTEAYPGHNPTFRVERGTLPLRGSKKKQANPFGGAPTVKSQSNHSENPVDEPNALVNYRRDELPSQRKKADANNASVKSRRKNTDAKVSGFSSVKVSSSPSVEVGFTSFSTSLGTPPALAEKTKGTTDGEKAKPTPKPLGKPLLHMEAHGRSGTPTTRHGIRQSSSTLASRSPQPGPRRRRKPKPKIILFLVAPTRTAKNAASATASSVGFACFTRETFEHEERHSCILGSGEGIYCRHRCVCRPDRIRSTGIPVVPPVRHLVEDGIYFFAKGDRGARRLSSHDCPPIGRA